MKNNESKQQRDITIIDIAKMAGVSQATVGRVIGGYGSVSKATRTKVETIIKELNYVPNAIAQSMKSKNTNTIGVVIGNIENPFFGHIVHSIETVCRKAGFNIIICNTGEDVQNEIAALKTLYSKRIDGLILSTAQKSNVVLNGKDKSLYTGSVPIVFIDREIFGIDELCVKSDHFGGSYQAASYLIDKGHTKIGLICGFQTSTMEQRVNGYKKALEDHGIEFKDEYIKFCDVASIEQGKQATKDLLMSNKEITAIIPLHNFFSMGSLLALHELHLKIPGDISVMGWDDFTLAEIMNPPLTVINQDTNSIGSLAAAKLIQVVQASKGEDAFGEKRITLNTRLIERESCGKPRKHKIL